METIQQQKRAIRKSVLNRLRSMSDLERSKRWADVITQLQAYIERRQPKTILAFLPMKHELPLDQLIQRWDEQGITIYVPGEYQPNGELIWWRWSSQIEWTEDSFGIRIPNKGQSLHHLPEDQVYDVIIVPGVAFDRDGGRLGYGGGYFDRWLARVKAVDQSHQSVKNVSIVSACLACQLVDHLPMQPWDQRIPDLIVERK